MKATTLAASAVAAVLGFVMVLVVLVDPSTEEDCSPGASGRGQSATLAPVGSVVKPTSPDESTFTSGFGPRWGSMHQGIDLAGPVGTAIYAYADGVVAQSGPAAGFGNWIVLDHNIGGPVSTVYGHMGGQGLRVKAGDTVRAGQHIADMGNAGKSTGPHLHFELWEGGRLTGGTAVDPKPAYDAALPPGVSGATPDAGSVPSTPPPAAGAELAALPGAVGSEAQWQIDTIRVARAVHAKFPQVQTIGGYRPTDEYDDHPSGRAADIMIPNYSSGVGIDLGNAVVDYLLSNAPAFSLEYMIWRQEYIPAQGQRSAMKDRGGDTANHYDHVHVTVAGHGFPSGNLSVSAPEAGSGAYVPGQTSGCTIDGGAPVGDNLAPGTVPPAFGPWLNRAGRLCPQIRPSLLAAQIQQESGFNPTAMSGSGAQGAAQFMPGTWPGYGTDDDGNGTSSPFDIGDAVMAQGRYMCQIAGEVDGWIAHGTVTAPNGAAELYLAGYNAGTGAVLRNRGFPSNASDYVVQTRPYADTILAAEPTFTTINR